ncbi:MAG: helix-turn-helix domain-containing protein [Parvularculaceae bacterium]
MARPREFDIGEALDGLVEVFWRNGYEGASMQAIEAATGLNKQSLYRVFADKRAMYLAALRRYAEIAGEGTTEMTARYASAPARFAALFDNIVSAASRGDRRGCFLCNAATDQAQLDDETKNVISAAMSAFERQFEKALADYPPYDRDSEARKARASSLFASYMGMRVLARGGASLRMLKAAAKQAVDAI